MIKIIENSTQRIVNDIEKVCKKDDILLNSIIQKINYKTNYKNKLNIINSQKTSVFGIQPNDMILEKTLFRN